MSERPQRFRFGRFELDEGRGELLRDGEPVGIHSTPLRMLAFLVRQPGRIVRREELAAGVWPDVTVSDAALASALRDLRHALSDDGQRQDRVQTIRGQGVRLLGPVDRSVENECATAGSWMSDSAFEADDVPDELAADGLRSVFVGRREVRATLRAACDGIEQLHGAAFIVRGEPGIGKTRLVEEVRAHARSRDIPVGWGRCHEGSSITPYWPWSQAIRSLLGRLGPGAFEGMQRSTLRAAAAVLPDLVHDDTETPDSREDDAARHRTFAAVAQLLERMAAPRGIVLILEDVHWSDPASVLLFAALAQDLRGHPALLVATCRPGEASEPSLLQALAGASSRAIGLDLEGLSRPETRELANESTGLSLDERIVDEVFARSGGNPFFATELLRAIRLREFRGEGGDASGRPQQVDDLIRRRIAQADAPCRSVLEVLAVIGTDAPASLIGVGTGIPSNGDVAPILEALSRARDFGILRSGLSDDGRQTFGFVHDLFREFVYDSLSSAERSSTHWRIGEALATTHGSSSPEIAPILAHHFFQAAAHVGADRAIEASLRAAEQSERVYGWAEAAAHHRRALELLERGDPLAAVHPADVLVKLGRALDLSGDPASESVFHRAAALERETGDASRFARAVLAFPVNIGGLLMIDPIDDALERVDRRIALMKEALDALGETEPLLRAALLERLALLDGRQVSPSVCRRYIDDSTSLARRCDDSTATARALRSRVIVLWDHEDYQTLRSGVDEAIERFTDLGDRTGVLDSLIARFMAAQHWGDAATAKADQARHARLSRDLHHPFHDWAAVYHAAFAELLQCNLPCAEELMFRSIELAQRSGAGECQLGSMGLLSHVRREQGRLGEFVPYADQRVTSTSAGEFRWALAFVYVLAEVGEVDRARELFESLRGTLDILRTREQYLSGHEWRLARWRFGWAMFADALALMQDPAHAVHAAPLYRTLMASRGRNSIGPGITLHFGPVDVRLGTLSMQLGRLDEAVSHLEDAVEIAVRSQTPLWVHHSRAQLVNALATRGRRGDEERAKQLAGEVRQDYQRHGMDHFIPRMLVG